MSADRNKSDVQAEAERVVHSVEDAYGGPVFDSRIREELVICGRDVGALDGNHDHTEHEKGKYSRVCSTC